MKTQLKSTYKKKFQSKPANEQGGNRPFGGSSNKPFGGNRKKPGYQGSKPNDFQYKGTQNGKPRFNKGNSFSRTKKVFREEKIDINRFIQKCSEMSKEEPFVPENHFADFAIEQGLMKNIAKKGYIEPTPIQDKVIPIALNGRDVVGIANTGTGKTAGFLIPAINKCLKNRSKTIIIVPTRELALQIDNEFRGFSAGMRMFSVLCIGGTSMGKQMSSLKRGYDFVIGTPGRIKDMAQRKLVKLEGFDTVVLDEVDRMLDMGFIDDISEILSKIPQSRQNLFFSATMPVKMEGLIGKFSKEPVKISVRKQEYSTNVNQTVARIGNRKKYDVLCELLGKEEMHKTIIFVKTKVSVDKLSEQLNKGGFNSDCIHGDKRQSKRERAISRFKSGQTKILVTTDVAARGLDINDISHVINYDIPATYDDYIHKIGRTGRGNKKGEAITFVG
jgi:superfamily II DNA/RNA helicase